MDMRDDDKINLLTNFLLVKDADVKGSLLRFLHWEFVMSSIQFIAGY